MISDSLKRRVKQYSEELVLKRGKKNKIPATVIGAEYLNQKEIDHSGRYPEPLASKLERELIKLGPLGSKRYENCIGCCCEVRSSNKILIKSNNAKIEHINFTEAVRPRTGERVKRCKNCREVFGNGL